MSQQPTRAAVDAVESRDLPAGWPELASDLDRIVTALDDFIAANDKRRGRAPETPGADGPRNPTIDERTQP